jgi:hypothetical protein
MSSITAEQIMEVVESVVDMAKPTRADMLARLQELVTALSIKDPNAPKRGKTAYMLFTAAEREKVKASLPSDAKLGDVTAELGKRWNALKASTNKKDVARMKKLEEEAAADKARYEEDKKAYVPPTLDEMKQIAAAKPKRGGKGTGTRSRVPKDPNAPKKNKSAYQFYVVEQRPDVKAALGEDATGADVTAELTAAWKALKEDASRAKEYKVYTDMAAADKTRYEDEMKNYVSTTVTAPATNAPAAKTGAKKPPQAPAKPADDDDDEVKDVDEEDDTDVEEEVKPAPVPPKAAPAKTSAAVPAKNARAATRVPKEEAADDMNVDDEKPEPAKKIPSKPLPPAPSKPNKTATGGQSAYQKYAAASRADVKTTFPNMKAAEVTKEIARMWKEMSDEDKAAWDM